ncbi:hypothetical protein N7451_010104 [Penicillium sp. IBT 35674x]|nr:hypothetical protein N7451_010104 [Penicillium sp. IBT 35674x]
MGWFDDNSDQAQAHEEWQQIQGPEHEAKFSHELLAGAASFAAARAYENHVAQNGQPPNHAMAKELLAGFAGAFIDREVETKGLDFVDREKAKRHAERQIEEHDESQFQY